MLFSNGLSIAGKPLILTDKREPKLTADRIFSNTHIQQQQQYQHEIANYRDCKPRTSPTRKPRAVHQRKIPLVDDFWTYRHVLPVSVLNLPRFAKVQTPRGRRHSSRTAEGQKQQQQRRPSAAIIYNDTVRRIRAANTNKELKVLVQRQLARCERAALKRKRGVGGAGAVGAAEGKKYKKPVKWLVAEGGDGDGDVFNGAASVKENDLQKSNEFASVVSQGERYAKELRKQQQRPHTDKVTNHSSDNNHRCNCSAANVATGYEENNAYGDKLTAYYYQLAADCYERDFLRNLRYLESIGKRNAINTPEQPEAANNVREATKDSNESSRNSSQSASFDTTAYTEEHRPQTEEVESSDARLTKLLERIVVKKDSLEAGQSDEKQQGQEYYQQQPTSKKLPQASTSPSDWAIRVNITPAVFGEDSRTEPTRFTNKSQFHGAAEEYVTKTNHCSMNDFFNCNNLQHIYTNNNSNNLSGNIGKNNNFGQTTTVTTHLNELIDNLQQLELNELRTPPLPKITLTDYTETNSATGEPNHIGAEHDLTVLSNTGRTTIYYNGPTSFGFNLSIPSEANYQSEARPP